MAKKKQAPMPQSSDVTAMRENTMRKPSKKKGKKLPPWLVKKQKGKKLPAKKGK